MARSLVAKRLDDKHMSRQAYTPLFDHVVAVNARSLIFLMAVPFALLVLLLFLRNSRRFAAHIVFTLHFYAFQLMLLCLADRGVGGPDADCGKRKALGGDGHRIVCNSTRH